MASSCFILLLLFAFEPGFSYVLEASNETSVIDEYHLRGEYLDLMSGVVKPFEAWYSAKYNKSRIDYYDGTVKNFYYGETEETSGKHYFVHPATTEEASNIMVCSKEPDDDKPMNILPSLENFTYAGEDFYNNKKVQVWKLLSFEDKKKQEGTVYLYKSNDKFIPMWLQVKVYNEWSGTLTKHRIYRYFDVKSPSEEDFDVKKVKACEDESKKSLKGPVKFLTEVEEAFFSFKYQHKRNYKGDEHEMRRKIFEANLREVIEHNKKNLSYKMTINEFSDRTDEELAYLTATKPSNPLETGSVPFPHSEEEINLLAEELPENYDMRVLGYISVVKNQAACGSCWSFSTTATVEGALARNYGDRNLDLSEQSLLDCSWGFYNGGCDGGYVRGTYQYVLKHGIPTEREYGDYLEEDGYCKLENMTEVYRIKGFAKIPPLSANALKVALYKYGPVTVTINATPIKNYASGIYYNPECSMSGSNHAVTVVGYGVRDGATYFIVKNSWGENWGEDGYILFSSINNNCNILEEGYYPIV